MTRVEQLQAMRKAFIDSLEENRVDYDVRPDFLWFYDARIESAGGGFNLDAALAKVLDAIVPVGGEEDLGDGRWAGPVDDRQWHDHDGGRHAPTELLGTTQRVEVEYSNGHTRSGISPNAVAWKDVKRWRPAR